MAKRKFILDSEKLSIEVEEMSFPQRLEKNFNSVFFSLIGGIGIFLLLWHFIELPREKHLENENNNLIFNIKTTKQQTLFLAEQLEDIGKRDNLLYRNFFGEPIISKQVRKAGFGGSVRHEKLMNLPHSELLIDVNRRLDILLGQIYIQSKSFDRLTDLVHEKEKMLSCIPMIQPVAQKYVFAISPFGQRRNPTNGTTHNHPGVDFCAPQGTEVYASGDGVVTRIKYNGGLGNYIIVTHGYGYKTWYGHLFKTLVKHGQRVKRGEVIGLVGTTGRSSVNHLHYEVHYRGKIVNPRNYYFDDLSDDDYEKMILISQKKGLVNYEL